MEGGFDEIIHFFGLDTLQVYKAHTLTNHFVLIADLIPPYQIEHTTKREKKQPRKEGPEHLPPSAAVSPSQPCYPYREVPLRAPPLCPLPV